MSHKSTYSTTKVVLAARAANVIILSVGYQNMKRMVAFDPSKPGVCPIVRSKGQCSSQCGAVLSYIIREQATFEQPVNPGTMQDKR
jgi:hypothetical protein